MAEKGRGFSAHPPARGWHWDSSDEESEAGIPLKYWWKDGALKNPPPGGVKPKESVETDQAGAR